MYLNQISFNNVLVKRIIISIIILLNFIILGYTWWEHSFLCFCFVAFVPLLLLEFIFEKSKIKMIYFFLITFFLLMFWISISIFWLYNCNKHGYFIAVFLASLLCSIPFVIYSLLQGCFLLKLISFTTAWLSIEYLQNHLDILVPYYQLGYILGFSPKLMQWYEYTGVYGGSLWIISINIGIFLIFKLFIIKEKRFAIYVKHFLAILLLIIVPILISIYLYNNLSDGKNKISILAINPYSDVFQYKYKVKPEMLLDDYTRYTYPYIKKELFVLWPENAITGTNYLDEIHDNKLINNLINFSDSCKIYLNTGILLSEKFITQKRDNPFDLRYDLESNMWHFTYSGSLFLNYNRNKLEFHTKSKLTPFEERIPYPKIFSPLAKFIPSLGGFRFSEKKNDTDLFIVDDVKIAPIICIESYYGEYTSNIVRKGANVIFLILNEGWYKSQVPKTHFLMYTTVRAVENRKYIARSSNYGIIAIVNSRGDIMIKKSEKKPNVIFGEIFLNNKTTFYTRYGDYIGKLSILITIIIIVWAFVEPILVKQSLLNK
ncbi:MAG: apolipoprotein N-acyltransferase [Bacteroidia bacterium]|nr:apolipoprotein N-acyltransferase [Bacteroidia bacterium]